MAAVLDGITFVFSRTYMERTLQNATFALIGSFSTPRRLTSASKVKRSGIVRVPDAFAALLRRRGTPKNQ